MIPVRSSDVGRTRSAGAGAHQEANRSHPRRAAGLSAPVSSSDSSSSKLPGALSLCGGGACDGAAPRELSSPRLRVCCVADVEKRKKSSISGTDERSAGCAGLGTVLGALLSPGPGLAASRRGGVVGDAAGPCRTNASAARKGTSKSVCAEVSSGLPKQSICSPSASLSALGSALI